MIYHQNKITIFFSLNIYIYIYILYLYIFFTDPSRRRAVKFLSCPGLAHWLVKKFKPTARCQSLSLRRGPCLSHNFKLHAPECVRVNQVAWPGEDKKFSGGRHMDLKNLQAFSVELHNFFCRCRESNRVHFDCWIMT